MCDVVIEQIHFGLWGEVDDIHHSDLSVCASYNSAAIRQRAVQADYSSSLNLDALPKGHMSLDFFSLGFGVGVVPHRIGVHLAIDQQ